MPGKGKIPSDCAIDAYVDENGEPSTESKTIYLEVWWDAKQYLDRQGKVGERTVYLYRLFIAQRFRLIDGSVEYGPQQIAQVWVSEYSHYMLSRCS